MKYLFAAILAALVTIAHADTVPQTHKNLGNRLDTTSHHQNQPTCICVHPCTTKQDSSSKNSSSRSLTTNSFNDKGSTGTTSKPNDALVLILLGMILGTTGQGIRVIIGLKKSNDSDAQSGPDGTATQPASGQFRATQLVVSLFISLVIGAIAGILAAVNSMSTTTDMGSLASTFIAAGYAGTDFIEGFMKRALPGNGTAAGKKNTLGSAMAR